MNEEQLKIYRKHMEIEKRHARNMHIELGQFYKYPDSCIAQFVMEIDSGILPASYREGQYKIPMGAFMQTINIQYVPCNKCMEKFISQLKDIK